MTIPTMPPPAYGTMVPTPDDAWPPGLVPSALVSHVTYRTELEAYMRKCAARELTPNEVVVELRDQAWTDAQARSIVAAHYVPSNERLPLLWWLIYGGFGFGVLGLATALHTALSGLDTDAQRSVFATTLAVAFILLPVATGAYVRSRAILADNRRALARFSPLRRKLVDVLAGCAATVGFVRLLAYLSELILHLTGGTTTNSSSSGLVGVAQVSVSVVLVGALTTFAWRERQDARSDETAGHGDPGNLER